jgi:hypothetical protein
MQSLWAVPPPVADSEHRCMHFFSHDCCATVGTDIVARQSKADAQTSFDIIASLEVAIAGQNIGAGQSAATTKIRQGQPRGHRLSPTNVRTGGLVSQSCLSVSQQSRRSYWRKTGGLALAPQRCTSAATGRQHRRGCRTGVHRIRPRSDPASIHPLNPNWVGYNFCSENCGGLNLNLRYDTGGWVPVASGPVQSARSALPMRPVLVRRRFDARCRSEGSAYPQPTRQWARACGREHYRFISVAWPFATI